MIVYCDKVCWLVKCFWRIHIQAIKRELNTKADKLMKGAAYGEYDKKNKLTTSNEYPLEVNMIEVEDELGFEVSKEDWMDPIVDYLKNCKELEDKSQARKLRIKATKYTLLDEVLYKKSFFGPLLRRVTREESKAILKSIHSGMRGNHSEGGS